MRQVLQNKQIAKILKNSKIIIFFNFFYKKRKLVFFTLEN